MSPNLRRLLFWLPRGLCILFAVFISLFALDVFGEGYSLGETIIAFTMHMIPTFAILLALILAWRWEWIGALLFAGLGVFYVVAMRGDVDLVAFAIISGPLFVIAGLFLANWVYHDEVRARV
ncbi:MAG: hypothetical protein J5I90_07590 [Caldilineales bacterium]|nr:hypothetical protein [Caldilineales bacterium]